MAVAYDAVSSQVGASGNLSWTHTPTGTPKGILVFVFDLGQSTDPWTAATYGGVAMTAVPGGLATDSAGEPFTCKAYFLGSSIPTGAQTVAVTGPGSLIASGVAISVTAGADTETNGVVLLEGDGTLSEQSVTDGSLGTDSVRFAGLASGLASLPSAGANSTQIFSNDDGSVGSVVVRETTAGQGSRSVGFSSGSTDDRAAVHLAVREAVVTAPDTTGADSGWSPRLGYQLRRRYSAGRGGNFLEYFEPSFSDPESVTADKFWPEYPAVVRRKAWRPEGILAYTEVPVPADVVDHGWEFAMPQIQRRWRDRSARLSAAFLVPQSQDPLTVSYQAILGTLTIEATYYGSTGDGVMPTYEGEGVLNQEGE